MPPPGAERDVLAASGFSPVYGAAWRKLNRPHFVDRFIAFDARRNGSAGDLSGEQWAVAPGDADYM
jgi:hypothetical protein